MTDSAPSGPRPRHTPSRHGTAAVVDVHGHERLGGGPVEPSRLPDAERGVAVPWSMASLPSGSSICNRRCVRWPTRLRPALPARSVSRCAWRPSTPRRSSRVRSPGRGRRPGGAAVSVFGPQKYTRTTGAKNVYETTVSVPSWVAGPFTLHIQNGEPNGSNRVSSAWITVNGVEVVHPSDLNQNVAALDRVVTLTPTTNMVVTLASKPGSFLIINLGGATPRRRRRASRSTKPVPGSVIATATPPLRLDYQDLVGAESRPPPASIWRRCRFSSTVSTARRSSPAVRAMPRPSGQRRRRSPRASTRSWRRSRTWLATSAPPRELRRRPDAARAARQVVRGGRLLARCLAGGDAGVLRQPRPEPRVVAGDDQRRRPHGTVREAAERRDGRAGRAVGLARGRATRSWRRSRTAPGRPATAAASFSVDLVPPDARDQAAADRRPPRQRRRRGGDHLLGRPEARSSFVRGEGRWRARPAQRL